MTSLTRKLAFCAYACSMIFTGRLATAAEPSLCSLSQVEVDPESVVEPCSSVIESKPVDAARLGSALFVRGKGYHNTKRFDLAAQDYDAAINLTPQNEELYVSRANIAFRGGRYREGMDFLQKALAINPSNAHALRSIGSLQDCCGDPNAAIQSYSRALAADPEEAYA